MKDYTIQDTPEILPSPQKILLGQLNSNGDCIFATTIAKQIKNDFPGCHLTWAIGSMCKSIIDGNPDVDDIWVIPLKNIGEIERVWENFKQEALEKKQKGIFDKIFLTQIAPGNLHNYDGTIRSSIFRGYPYPITVSVTPILRLSSIEIEKVKRFAELHQLREKTHVILFETSPQSGQSFLTFDFAKEVAKNVISTIPNSCMILSSSVPFSSCDESIIDGSVISIKEHIELSKYCTLLIGGSSGISWSCTSDWAKHLPMIQLLKTDSIWFNSFVHDHERWGLPTNKIIEMVDCSSDHLYNCIITALLEGFDKSRCCYHETIHLPYNYFLPILNSLLRKGEFNNLLRFYFLNVKKIRMVRQLFIGLLLVIHFLIACHFKLALMSIKKWILEECRRNSH